MEDEFKEEKVPAAEPTKSKMPILAGAVGLLVFVLFIAVFSISMGVFSSSNVVHKPGEGTEEADPADAEDEQAEDPNDFHSSYYEDVYSDLNEPDSTEGMTEEDSLAQVAWYEKQKMEIASEMRKLELKRAELEKLKYETTEILERRKNIEDANLIQMAKLFDTMKAPEIAQIVENMTDDQVGMILMKMKRQNASKVLAEIPAERAARITTQMMNLAEGY